MFALRNRPLSGAPGSRRPTATSIVEVGRRHTSGLDDLDTGRRFPARAGRVYRVDPVAGEISFGNFDPQTEPDGARSHRWAA